MVSPDHAGPDGAHEEECTVPPSAPRAHPQLFPGAETDFQRCGGGPKQQGQSHYEKIVRLSHLPSPRTCTLSLTWQAARAGIHPRFLLTSQKIRRLVLRRLRAFSAPRNESKLDYNVAMRRPATIAVFVVLVLI